MFPVISAFFSLLFLFHNTLAHLPIGFHHCRIDGGIGFLPGFGYNLFDFTNETCTMQRYIVIFSMNVVALCLFLLVPGVHFWLDALSMVLFGLGIGVLICFLGGLMAVDIAPRTASGAALGVVGIASYIGAGLQDVMSGVLIEGNKHVVNGVEVYDFTYINWFWIGAALMSVLLALLVWNARNRE